MATTARTYKHKGVSHPLEEGAYDTAFKCYKSDKRKAVIGDPEECIEAKGLCKMPGVVFAHIGSGGDAYVGYKDIKSPTGITVRHFTIPAESAKVRDTFDKKGSPSTQILWLRAPAQSRTLAARAKMNTAWREKVKNGSHSPTKRGPQKNRRIVRLGVSPRPKAKIEKSQVSLV